MKNTYVLSILLIGSTFFKPSNANAQLVSGGTGHSVAVCLDGTLSAWGLNDQNELGQGVLSSNACVCEASGVAIPVLSGVDKIGAGGSHTLALMNDGTVKGWGRNFDGELGNGLQTMSGCYCDLNIVNVNGLSNVKSVSAGNISSMALKNDGTVWGWGGDNFGQLGDGTANLTGCFCELAPVQATGLTGITEITNGSYHALALKGDGTVWAWGNNMNGQLGNGNTTSNATPTQLSLTGIIGIAAGQNHSFALKNDGTVWAWGDNGFGQLGTAGGTNNLLPSQVVGLTNVVQIANGFNHSIALKSDGTVWTWGGNYSGQLGIGNTNSSSTPVMVPGLTGVSELGGTMGNFCLAVKADGSIWSWGDNTWGSVGNSSSNNALNAVQVQNVCAVPTNIKKVENSSSLKVFPNPVSNSNFISIELKNIKIEGTCNLEITNMLGEKVYQTQVKTNVSNYLEVPLNSGIYLLRVNNNELQLSEKLIIE